MKLHSSFPHGVVSESPSMRREWIEMHRSPYTRCLRTSPSMRREWIEIGGTHPLRRVRHRSPSMRREWIEIPVRFYRIDPDIVSLHAEGVD